MSGDHRSSLDLSSAVLLIIDFQCAIDAPYWSQYGPRNNPDAEAKIARLLGVWRAAGAPVVHIRHDSTNPNSAYRPGQPGNDFKPEAAPIIGELVVAKRTNNGFIDTDLEIQLRALGAGALVVAGVTTNNSVESTVRMAGNLGFETFLVEDACFTFPRPDYRGDMRSADAVHAMSLANLDREYCTVVTTDDVVALRRGDSASKRTP